MFISIANIAMRLYDVLAPICFLAVCISGIVWIFKSRKEYAYPIYVWVFFIILVLFVFAGLCWASCPPWVA